MCRQLNSVLSLLPSNAGDTGGSLHFELLSIFFQWYFMQLSYKQRKQ